MPSGLVCHNRTCHVVRIAVMRTLASVIKQLDSYFILLLFIPLTLHRLCLYNYPRSEVVIMRMNTEKYQHRNTCMLYVRKKSFISDTFRCTFTREHFILMAQLEHQRNFESFFQLFVDRALA